MLIMGFVFGSTAILNPAVNAYQDSWLAYIIGWMGGIILIYIYGYISKLNPSKTLVEILQCTFGNFFGNILAILYVFYFIHLSALILRNFGEYMVITTYTETPMLFIMVSVITVVAYCIRKGLEVTSRVAEFLVPLLIFNVLILFLLIFNKYDINNFLPFLERGFSPILKTAFSVLSFPFGETIVFLMIIPNLNNKKDIIKSSIISILIIGFVIFTVLIRDLLSLGADMLSKIYFPPSISTKLLTTMNIDPLINTNLLIGGGIKITVCTYAAAMGICQLFKLDNYKMLIIPISLIVLIISKLIYNNVFEMINWSSNIYPYYALPFQVIIPIIILIISLMKKRVK